MLLSFSFSIHLASDVSGLALASVTTSFEGWIPRFTAPRYLRFLLYYGYGSISVVRFHTSLSLEMARYTTPAVSVISSALPYELSRPTTTTPFDFDIIEPKHNANSCGHGDRWPPGDGSSPPQLSTYTVGTYSPRCPPVMYTWMCVLVSLSEFAKASRKQEARDLWFFTTKPTRNTPTVPRGRIGVSRITPTAPDPAVPWSGACCR